MIVRSVGSRSNPQPTRSTFPLDMSGPRCEPPNLLSFTWSEEPANESEVTFELAERDAEFFNNLTNKEIRG